MPIGSRPVSMLGIALFESGKIYEPQSLAKRIVNLTRTPEATLKTFEGIGRFDPKAGTLNALIMGIGHSETLDGANQVTVVRYGSTLVRHAGWSRSYVTLASNLTYDPNQSFPDVCLPINGKIVWSNGFDRPLMVDCSKEYGRLVVPLGFSQAPSAPIALSPSRGGADAASGGSSFGYGAGAGEVAPNMQGYSVPGNIGTVSTFNGEDGSLLDGSWLYAYCWESIHGDVSPLSPPSNAATLQQQSCGYMAQGSVLDFASSKYYVRKNKLDMLLRGFCVRGMDKGESHVKAVRLYRKTDTAHSDGEYHLVSRIEGRSVSTYPDFKSDAALTNADTPVKAVAVEPFRLACEHQGRLIAANYASNPGLVRWSQPGFLGTFEEDAWLVPDAGGSQVTGLVSFAGAVYILTEQSVFRLEFTPNGPKLQTISPSIGCIAPASCRITPNHLLVFLSRTGIFATDGQAIPQDISLEIKDTLAKINISRAGRAVAEIDPQTGEYVLGIPVDSNYNDRIFAYDYAVGGWREYDLGIYRPTAMHACAGRAGHLLMGFFPDGQAHELRLWNHPDVAGSPSLTSTYETANIRIDPQALTSFRVREILIGFLESDAEAGNPGCSIRVWRTNRLTGTTPSDSYYDTTMELVGQDFLDAWRLGTVVLNGTGAYYRDPVITWRRVLVDVGIVTSFRFKLTVQNGRRLNLLGLAIIAEGLGKEASRTPGPSRS